jgi:catechol 2,3-dioxygenase-like lactoylglutathione lyase family enzyme
MKKVILLLLLIQFYSVVNSQEKKDFTLSFNHIALSVKDINVSAQFYTNVLNLEIIPSSQKYDDVKWISLGEGKELHLVSYVAGEIKTNKAIHLALSTTNFDVFVQRLIKMNIEYSDFPGTINKTNVRPDGIKQVFFQDPDGYWIEVNSISK